MKRVQRILEASDWIGVDLDGTLAKYDTYKGTGIIGAPVDKMVDRVKGWLKDGETVKIFTARVASSNKNKDKEVSAIKAWTKKYIGQELEVTAEKDRYMKSIYDDRAIGVKKNTGDTVESIVQQLRAMKESAAIVDIKMVMDMARDVIPKREIESRLKKYLADFEDEIHKLIGGNSKVVNWSVGIH